MLLCYLSKHFGRSNMRTLCRCQHFRVTVLPSDLMDFAIFPAQIRKTVYFQLSCNVTFKGPCHEDIAFLIKLFSEVITWYLYPCTNCSCSVMINISNKFHQRAQTIIFFLGGGGFHVPCLLFPSIATDDRKQFQCQNIV